MSIVTVSLVTCVVGILIYALFIRRKEIIYYRALENSQEQAQQYLSRIDYLISALKNIHEFVLKLTSTLSKEEVSQYIAEVSCKLLRASFGIFMSVDQTKVRSNELEIVGVYGLPTSSIAKQLKANESIIGKVLLTGKVIIIEDTKSDTHITEIDKELFPSKSLIFVPLQVKGRITGVLSIGSEMPFEEPDVHLLTILADQSAFVLENLTLYKNLQTFYTEMIQFLARLIDARDSYTYDHADRAGKYAREICKKLNLPEEITKHIEYAAFIHDIGKIVIDNSILHKPTSLNFEERKVIQRHPLIGSEIIKPLMFLSPIAPIILFHHEWYNGQGYPNGLAGEEIPLGARIISVIDAYDAMTSDRPYRKALPRSTAIEELKKAAGIQFDPEIVDAFLHILTQE